MPPLSIMIKPASALCNMRCKYCFYHDVTDHRDVKSFGLMSEETAENLIKKALDFADGESIAFAFQGGEPTIRGLDFFRFFCKTVDENNTKNSTIHYGLQTNGTLIDDRWAKFFKQRSFLIGLSLDGDFKNNSFRIDQKGENAYYKIIKAANIFEKHGVDFNILTVLTGRCAENIDDVLRAFKKRNFKYLQFIPCLRPFGDTSESELYMTVEQYKHYLIHGFNAYVKDYVRDEYTSIRYFDNLVHLYLGNPTEQCGMCGHCTHQFVAEGNGNIYPCDFYCTDDWLLGNINNEKENFDTLAHCEKAIKFLKESIVIKEECKSCKYFSLCRSGGCKRTREDRNYCESYKAFFDACLPLFRVFIAEKKH